MIRACAFIIVLFSQINVSAESDLEITRALYGEYLAARSTGRYLQAREKLLQMLPYENGIPPYNKAVLYNSLGYTYWQLGLYNESEIHYQRANQIIQQYNLNEPLLQSGVYNDQAILFKQIGEYESAKEYFENAERILNQLGRKDSDYYDQLSMVLFNKSLVFIKTEEYSEALELLHEAERIKETYGFVYLGSVYFNLARCYSMLKSPDLAEEYYLKSIGQWIREKGPGHFELASVYLEYGQFLSEKGDDAGSEEYFDLAIHNYLANKGPKHPYTASCYNLMSDTYFAKSEFRKALINAQKALIAVCPDFENDSIETNPVLLESTNDLRLLKIYTSKIKALIAFANIREIKSSQKQMDYLQLALVASEESVRVLERIRGSFVSQESRLFLARSQKQIFIRGIEIARQLHELSGDPDFIEKAYLFAAYGKTLELSNEKKQKEHLYIHSLKDTSALEFVRVKEHIESYSHLIQMEQSKQRTDYALIDSLKQIRFGLKRDYEALHKYFFGPDLEAENTDLFERNTLEIVQSRLKRKQSLIEYTISGPGEYGRGTLFAFVIDRKGLQYHCAEVDSAFYRDIERIQTDLHDYDPYRATSDDYDSLKRALSNLYSQLIHPLEQWLDKEQILIIPDDELAGIPLEALIQNSSKRKNHLESSSYLINSYDISYALNASLVDHTPFNKLRRPKLKVISQDYSNLEKDELSHLAFVNEEGEKIQSIMKGIRVSATQSKADLMKEIREADLLHFSLHLFPSGREHSSGYMVLHQDADSSLSNLLFDYEIEALNLSTPMVVINACESGSGTFYRGEGMLSLSRSFLLAGAKSVVNALWPVDDKAGSSMMISFYKNLAKGQSKSQALRKAKLRYLEHASPSFAHPYYWAGYQMTGNRSPLFMSRWLKFSGLAGILMLILIFSLRKRRNVNRTISSGQAVSRSL